MAPEDLAANARIDEQRATADETGRIYQTSRWVGPLGCGIGSVLLTLILWSDSPQTPLAIWLVMMLVIVSAMIAAFAVPYFATRIGPVGLPRLAQQSHALVGAGFASLLWFDPMLRDDVVSRWAIVAVLFAISAGVANGLSGLNTLGLRVIVPMWTTASIALVAADQYLMAAGGVVFMVIVSIDQHNSGQLWRELIVLRVREARQADVSAWQADHDELTGLLNRSGAIRLLQAQHPWAHDVSALYLDLDHFKEVNDRFGHPAGDQLLRLVAERLKRAVRDDDMVARMGGDEFFVVLARPVPESRLVEIGTTIIRSLEEPFDLDSGEAYISASMGYTTLTAALADPARLMIEADHAMYEAKRRGRRQIAGFNSDLEAERIERSGLETQLRKAIRNRALTTAAQPVFDLESREIYCVELLARWTLADGSRVPPSLFIPLAEEVGLIDELTTQMLDEAGALLGAWASIEALSSAKISVNVSPIQIAKGKLFETVQAVLDRHDVADGRLVLEVTESATLSDLGGAAELFERLRAIGVELAIDDFGTGYSSLGHLMSLPVTVVKIDRTLIAGLVSDPRQRAIMVAVRDLAGVLGQQVIAEGVEDDSQATALVEMGITLGQGFGLCRPVPSETLPDRLTGSGSSVS